MPDTHLLPSAPPQPQRSACSAAIRPQVHARLRAHKEASRPAATSAPQQPWHTGREACSGAVQGDTRRGRALRCTATSAHALTEGEHNDSSKREFFEISAGMKERSRAGGGGGCAAATATRLTQTSQPLRQAK